jgi:AcrR family transcriptional regulator
MPPGFQDRHPERVDADREQQPHQRVDRVSLEGPQQQHLGTAAADGEYEQAQVDAGLKLRGQDVAEESGWSIGSIRHYFPNKDELIASALWRVGERVDDRIRQRTAGGMTMNEPRIADVELLPLDADRREEALVHLAFLAQVVVEPALADAAEGAAQRLQEPLAARLAYAVKTGELPAHLDAEHEAARLRVLLDGLRLQLVTTPKHTSASWALAVLDDHLAALAGP